MRNEHDATLQDALQQKDAILDQLSAELAQAQCARDDATLSHEEALRTLAELRERLARTEVRVT